MMSSLVKRLALPAIVLIWSASYFVEVLGYSKKNQYLIKPVFIAMAILFAVNAITDVMEWKKEQRDAGKREIREKETGERETGAEAAARSPVPAEERQTLLRSLFVVLSMAAYILILPHLGFVISTVLLAAGLLLLMQVRKLPVLILLPVILTGVLYAAFKLGLHIPLPAGFLGF